MSINKVFISGNLTRDAELSATKSGLSILNIGVAVNDRRKNQAGEWEDYPNFVDCKMFGTRAEALASRLTKGTRVIIEGKLHYSSWEGKDGSRRSKLDVTVDEIELPRRDDAAAVQQAFPGAKVSQYADDEIPF